MLDLGAGRLAEVRPEQVPGTGAILNLCRQHCDPQQQAQGVHQDGSLAPVDLLAGIVAPLVAALGATNAIWIWSPNVITAHPSVRLAPLYPGDDYVDWVGMVGYYRRVYVDDKGKPVAKVRVFDDGKCQVVTIDGETGEVTGVEELQKKKSGV